ncbi:hypothetical protein PG994_012175 [Apiospora phragmitis]|uniref:Uncharacterized protein n=1 Tax=Apiospora phragmitis TaxID=2905665 RepID=A0ABR1TUY6_9PEZI
MKFTGLVIPFLVAYAQADLPYNLRDTFGSHPRGVAEPRHFPKTHDGQHHGATGTGGIPHHRPTGTGHHRPHPTKYEGMLPGQRGAAAADPNNGDGQAWGPNPGEQHHGVWPPVGKGKGHPHGTGIMSFQPFPRPTGGYHHHPPGTGHPPKWPKTTLSTRTMSHYQQGASPSIVAQATEPAQPEGQDDE